MQSVLYADVLFFINFSMDFISLYITMRLLHRKVGLLRYLAAALLGAVYGVLQVVFETPRALTVILSLAVSFLMTVITIGRCKSFKIYLRYTVILWGISALIAGGVTLVCTLGSSEGLTAINSRGQSSMFVLAVGVFLTLFIVRMFFSSPKAESCELEVHIFGSNIKTAALVDTGNLVTEPISGLPVIFISKKAISPFYNGSDLGVLCGDVSHIDRLSPDTRCRVRVISVKRVGEAKLLFGVMACGIALSINKEKKKVNACVVIEDTEGYGGYDALLPSTLLA